MSPASDTARVEADASRDKETQALLEGIRKEHDAIDVFVSNVCVVMRGQGEIGRAHD